VAELPTIKEKEQKGKNKNENGQEDRGRSRRRKKMEWWGIEASAVKNTSRLSSLQRKEKHQIEEKEEREE
jgi:hypothetical protein